eukprot:TRINITY_DN17559_c0_g1_i1.p2 TRINITY_DN17559_c0_g1~~TRINITY_DN17559_c0_g1_i1.p2  ORF type:complete len:105 (-),score=17.16 TRINITY_DN17559_c0_g1_i1:66-380(-)
MLPTVWQNGAANPGSGANVRRSPAMLPSMFNARVSGDGPMLARLGVPGRLALTPPPQHESRIVNSPNRSPGMSSTMFEACVPGEGPMLARLLEEKRKSSICSVQ